ncbi:MAG: hypothetical protein IJP04_07680, partial [Clostridia bacterium]|nr:hypothetical protein [Clostridia bacterium]
KNAVRESELSPPAFFRFPGCIASGRRHSAAQPVAIHMFPTLQRETVVRKVCLFRYRVQGQ